jgi:hypothetical protein
VTNEEASEKQHEDFQMDICLECYSVLRAKIHASTTLLRNGRWIVNRKTRLFLVTLLVLGILSSSIAFARPPRSGGVSGTKPTKQTVAIKQSQYPGLYAEQLFAGLIH